VALGAATVGGPVHEAAEAVAVFPGEAEEFRGGHVVGFFAEKRFKAPAKVGLFQGWKR